MYRKFKHLNIPDGWEQYWSKYPNGYTIMEALIDWVSQVDDMVTNQNELTDTVKSFGERIDEFINQFGAELQKEVQDLLTEWQASGQLDVVISEALQWQLDDYIATNEQDKLSLTAQLQQTTGINIDTFEKESGETNDTGRIQRAIDYAESLIRANVDSWAFSQLPPVIIPEGTYIVDGLVISSPLVLKGISQNGSILKSSGENKPIIKIRGLSKSISSTSMEDIKPRIENLSIIGTAPSGYDNQYTSTMTQHGVELDNSDNDYHANRIEVHHCNIRHCLGHGIKLGTSVSNRIFNNNITLNVGDGIYMTGSFNTDVIVAFNSIRRNRIGVNVNPTNSTITTGTIMNNTIESNRNGTGQAGFSARPCVGIMLRNVQLLTIKNNYFERHLNDIYGVENVSYNLITDNYFDSSSNLIPNYDGYAPTSRRLGAIAFGGGVNWYNKIKDNRLYKPLKPSSVSDEDWQTTLWGETYDELNAMGGCSYTEISDNHSNDYISKIGITHNQTAYINRKYRTSGKNWKEEKEITDLEENTVNYIQKWRRKINETKVTASYDTPETHYYTPEIVNTPFKQKFMFGKLNSEGEKENLENAYGVNDKNEFAVPFEKGIAFQKSLTNNFLNQYARSVVPTQGDYERGDIVWNTFPSAGGNVGWVCTSTGSPGTWKEFGTIAP